MKCPYPECENIEFPHEHEGFRVDVAPNDGKAYCPVCERWPCDATWEEDERGKLYWHPGRFVPCRLAAS